MTDSGSSGIVAVVKHDCPTCTLVAPVLEELVERGVVTTVHRQRQYKGIAVCFQM